MGGNPKPRRQSLTELSDDEIRKRIFGLTSNVPPHVRRLTYQIANAAVLFPGPTTFIVAYASKPVATITVGNRSITDGPWQYALLVRQTPSGEYVLLMRGSAWSSQTPWSMVLQSLLDSTAEAIHQHFASTDAPAIGCNVGLPQYQADGST